MNAIKPMVALLLVGLVGLQGCASQRSESALDEAAAKFQTVKDDVKVAEETFECTGMVTVTGAGAFESPTDRTDTH